MAGVADAAGAVNAVTARPVSAVPTAALRSGLLAVPPPLVALTLAGAALAAHYALWGATAPFGRVALAGASIAGLGQAWVLWAWAHFRAARTPLRTADMPLQLIEEGPYRYGRNPMYLGITFMLLGTSLGLGAPLLALSAGLFAATVSGAHIPHEEAQMLKRFGGWYRDYTASTRRWL